MKKPTIVDCTFRDGGYYTNWVFAPETIGRYFVALSQSNVDIIEVGFRFLVDDGFVGPFGYATDEYIGSLALPDGLTLAVMINAKEFLAATDGALAAIDRTFAPARSSPVEIVRYTATIDYLEETKPIAERLNALGYRVCVNLMQADRLSGDQIEEAAALVGSWGGIEVFYFADSFGNMTPDSVRAAVHAVRRGWQGPIGIHPHNNKGKALDNALAALDAGATYIDSTVLGMGRGAGNLETETLLLELQEMGGIDYVPDALFSLVLQDFTTLKREHGWGPSLLFRLSATHSIHPTYVQAMLGSARYGSEQILSAMAVLKEAGASSFSEANLDKALVKEGGVQQGSWSSRGWSKGRAVLILGAGKGVETHRDAIVQFIERQAPLVVSLNVNRTMPSELVDIYAACHEVRINVELSQYKSLGKPVMLPRDQVAASFSEKLQDVEILDYGMEVSAGRFDAHETGCVLPSSIALGYVLAAASVGDADKMLMAGFDGYVPGDPHQEEVVNLLRLYNKSPTARPLIAVTPTTYPIRQASVYSPYL